MDQQKFLKQEQEKTLLQIVHYRNFMLQLMEYLRQHIQQVQQQTHLHLRLIPHQHLENQFK